MSSSAGTTSRILLLSTGGTIASAPGDNGLIPTLGPGCIIEHLGAAYPDCEFCAENLMSLDSSNIQPEHWSQIAGRVFEVLDEYDGVVVTHGTDTMAYTAAAMSFMLRNLKKSVVLTGSQIPFGEPLSDAIPNIQTAIEAVRSRIPGVTVAFGYKVINGTRAVKTSTMEIDAFSSVGAPPIAVVEAAGLRVFRDRVVPFRDDEPTTLENDLSPDVFLLKLLPGTRPELLDALADMGYRGLVIEAFGAGGVHYEGKDLPARIKKLTNSGVAVVACSQCLSGWVDLSIYEVGRRLLDSGVIPAGDMTTEAAVVKLKWALGRTSDPAGLKAIFSRSYAGEIGK